MSASLKHCLTVRARGELPESALPNERCVAATRSDRIFAGDEIHLDFRVIWLSVTSIEVNFRLLKFFHRISGLRPEHQNNVVIRFGE